MRKIFACVAFAGLALAPLTAVSAQNLVSNGDFGAGFTDWTVNGASSYPWSISSGAASTGCVGAQCTDPTNLGSAAYLYQDLATVAGGIYTLSFDYTPANGTPNELKGLFDGAVAFDYVNYASGTVSYSISGLVASGNSTRLMFLGRQDPSYNYLDNISVVQTGTASVPEPASWALMLGGFGMIGGALRSRRGTRVHA